MESTSQYYVGKHVLLTGSTGFVGKVLVDKILRTLPDIGCLYLLIRGKKGSNVTERFKKEVLGSQCFDRLKKLKGAGFDEFINNKLMVIEGDLMKDRLGLSEQAEQMIINNAHVLINCAASIDFNASIPDALGNNYFGTQKMFDLAMKVKNLENFVHISTAYVNCEKPGQFIEEKIYDEPLLVDVEKYVQELMRTPKNLTEKQRKEIIGKFPNTYTFTKSLTERMLLNRYKPGTTLTIMRPTIVGSSFRDPVPGWIDSMTGSAATYFFGGIGLVRVFSGNEALISDQIPVDFVADYIIVGTAYWAKKQTFEVMHIGSSLRNPATIKAPRVAVMEYWNQNVPKLRVARSNVVFSKSRLYYKLHTFGSAVPALAYKGVANITRNAQMKKEASRWVKMLERAHMVNETFTHFWQNEWIFDAAKTHLLMAYLTPEEKQTYLLDVTVLDWPSYLYTFNYGIQKFILKENVDPPGDPQITNLFSLWDYYYFSDIQWARSQGQPFATKTKREHISLVMNSQRVQLTIKQVQKERMKKLGRTSHDPEKATEKIYRDIIKQATEICEQMFADYNFTVLRMVAWVVNKTFKQIYEKVVLDENFLTSLANHNQKLNGPLVFTPTHKSYIDFLIVSYIFYAFKIKCPHVAGAEDFLQMTIIPQILRACGAFFLRRQQFEENILYRTIFYEYVQRLLMDECYLEFFVEGTRSRTGKIMAPKFGLLGIVVDTVAENKIPDATIIPITINYEKVLEADTYPLELLGENKVRESLLRVLKATALLTQNQGRIYVEFGEPISVKNSLQHRSVENNKDRKIFVEELGYQIVYNLIDKLVIMPTSMVAAIILMNRKGIQEDQLVNQIEWLANQIQTRGGKIGSINDCSAVISVRNSINHLKDTVVKTKRNIFELQVTPNLEYKNILLLSYYKNQLVHVFFEESICTCALNSFGHQIAFKEGLDVNRLWEETDFLLTLLNKEIFVKKTLTSQSKLNDMLQKMVFRGTLVYINSQKIKAIETDDQQSMNFLCSLVWPLVESYWVTLIYIYSIQRNQTQLTVKRLIQQVQLFAESIYEERVMDYYEACSLETITNAVQTFETMHILKVDKEFNEKNQQFDEYVKVIVTEERLLELEIYIKKFMKNAFTKSFKQPIEIVTKNILEFPIMAKL